MLAALCGCARSPHHCHVLGDPQGTQLWNSACNHRPVPSQESHHLLPPKAVLVLVGDQAASEEVVAYSTLSRKEVLLPPASSGQAKQLIRERVSVTHTLADFVLPLIPSHLTPASGNCFSFPRRESELSTADPGIMTSLRSTCHISAAGCECIFWVHNAFSASGTRTVSQGSQETTVCLAVLTQTLPQAPLQRRVYHAQPHSSHSHRMGIQPPHSQRGQ